MEISANTQQQSIKESTARNLHALGGLELSSIVESASMSKFEDLHEDKGLSDHWIECPLFRFKSWKILLTQHFSKDLNV